MNRMVGLIIVGAALLAVAAYVIITSITNSAAPPQDQPQVDVGEAQATQTDTIFIGDTPVTVTFVPAKQVRLQSSADADAAATVVAAQQTAQAQPGEPAAPEPTATSTIVPDLTAVPATAVPAEGVIVSGSCAGGGAYVVQPSDNLFRIALRFGTTVQALQTLNGLTSDRILVGQVLCVPGDVAVTCTSGQTHVVQAGDNLFRIALRYGTTVQTIQTLNGFTGDRIVVGQVLCVPGTAVTPDPNVNCGANTAYVVQRGDNVYRLSLTFNTTVEAIKTLNNLGDNYRIEAGQTICIPVG